MLGRHLSTLCGMPLVHDGSGVVLGQCALRLQNFALIHISLRPFFKLFWDLFFFLFFWTPQFFVDIGTTTCTISLKIVQLCYIFFDLRAATSLISVTTRLDIHIETV